MAAASSSVVVSCRGWMDPCSARPDLPPPHQALKPRRAAPLLRPRRDDTSAPRFFLGRWETMASTRAPLHPGEPHSASSCRAKTASPSSPSASSSHAPASPAATSPSASSPACVLLCFEPHPASSERSSSSVDRAPLHLLVRSSQGPSRPLRQPEPPSLQPAPPIGPWPM